jgi:hypothetical protein
MAFSTAAVAMVVLSAWWLYFSPIKKGRRLPARQRPAAEQGSKAEHGTAVNPRLAAWLAGLLGLSALLLVVGAFWDASMHIQTGEIPGGADFLWPPHLLIYSAFLLSFLVAAVAMGMLAVAGRRAGQADPRLWLRRNPFLGAVALASLYSLMSIPGDALWHLLYGVDLTAWSPPHVLLALMSCTVLVSALGLLAQVRPAERRLAWTDLATIALLGLMLNVAYMVGVIEWELPGALNPYVEARPIWLYPLVGGAAAFFALMLAKALVPLRWAATLTAAVFYGVRLGVGAGLAATDNVVPYMPLWFILGALLLDVVPWQSARTAWLRTLAAAGTFTLGYALLALPGLEMRPEIRAFTSTDMLMMLAATLAASLVLLPVARWAAERLRRRTA